MLTLVDVMGMCDCTVEEIEAIAIHEGISDAVASDMANYLIHSDEGILHIRRIIIDDIDDAQARGNNEMAAKLQQVLLHFIARHPDYTGSKKA